MYRKKQETGGKLEKEHINKRNKGERRGEERM
jgi:hypothetical protein